MCEFLPLLDISIFYAVQDILGSKLCYSIAIAVRFNTGTEEAYEVFQDRLHV